MIDDAALAPFERFDFQDGQGRWTRPVFRRGRGPAVIVIHEMPGLHSLVLRFASRVAEAGMTVFCPSLFGEPGRDLTAPYYYGTMLKTLCVRREFVVWAGGRSSPIVDWLRALARHAHAECGGKGVGAIGMCFTGGFALAMMTEPAVVAPVVSQPSLPLTAGPGGERRGASIDASPSEIACARQRLEAEDTTMLGLRFKGDRIVPEARFDAYRRALGSRFEAIEIDPKDARHDPRIPPHCVLTIHLDDENPDGPTKRAEARVIAFFKEKTGA